MMSSLQHQMGRLDGGLFWCFQAQLRFSSQPPTDTKLQELRQAIRKLGIHVDADCSDRTMQKKVRKADKRSQGFPRAPLMHSMWKAPYEMASDGFRRHAQG